MKIGCDNEILSEPITPSLLGAALAEPSMAFRPAGTNS
jgi:hypothetical protein